jgi:acyl carrier protein
VSNTSTLDDVKSVVIETLGIEEDRAASLDGSTELLGSLPELDSMAVVELVTVLEERFGFEVDDADITGEVFETLGSLAAFVEARAG